MSGKAVKRRRREERQGKLVCEECRKPLPSEDRRIGKPGGHGGYGVFYCSCGTTNIMPVGER